MSSVTRTYFTLSVTDMARAVAFYREVLGPVIRHESDTWTELGFAFDGKRYITLWKDGVQLATVDLTTTLTTYLPDTELTISFGLKNGEAVAKTLSIDYIFVAQER